MKLNEKELDNHKQQEEEYIKYIESGEYKTNMPKLPFSSFN